MGWRASQVLKGVVSLDITIVWCDDGHTIIIESESDNENVNDN